MSNKSNLIVIKIIHTLVWLFFNWVIFYMLYASIMNKLDRWLWIGYGLFMLEGFILLAYKGSCPITAFARRYSTSSKDNFDIFLPLRLARNTFPIYTFMLAAVILITIYQLIK